MLGYRIKELRLKHKLSQVEVGGILGIDFRQVSMTEKGKRKLTVDELQKFCRLVDLTPNEVLEWH